LILSVQNYSYSITRPDCIRYQALLRIFTQRRSAGAFCARNRVTATDRKRRSVEKEKKRKKIKTKLRKPLWHKMKAITLMKMRLTIFRKQWVKNVRDQKI
jgi:hypothetical protein